MPPPRPTNTLAIIALVTAFVFAPAGIICGIIARRQIKQTGEQGDGMALAGLILGIVFTLIFVVLVVIWLLFIAAAVTVVSHFPTQFPTDFFSPSPFPTS